MTVKTDPDTDLRLHVRFEDSSRNSFGDLYAHVYVIPVIMARGRFGRQEYDAHDLSTYEIEVPAPVKKLKGLRVKAQMDDRNRGFYAYRLHFSAEHDEVTLTEAERMLPVLRRLDKRMTALSDKFGYPRDLAMFLSHVADALGLTGRPFVRRITDDADYEGHGHRSMSANDLRYWLDSQVQEWRKRHGIADPGELGETPADVPTDRNIGRRLRDLTCPH